MTKSRFAPALVLLLTLVAALGQTHLPPKQSGTVVLQQIERDWAAAFVHKDQAALGRILAPGWRDNTPGETKIGRRLWRRSSRARLMSSP